MKEVRSRSHLQRPLLLLPFTLVAAFGAACGGSSLDAFGSAGASAAGGQLGQGAGAGGRSAGAGSAGAPEAAAGGTAGNSAGAGSRAGSSGVGGASAGSGGASAGSGGASGGGSGGSSGNSGSAGMGLAGGSGVCHARPPQPCGGGAITLPKSCVSDTQAVVGTALTTSVCRTMCETMFAFSCTISAVQQASITVQCVTGCPAAHD